MSDRKLNKEKEFQLYSRFWIKNSKGEDIIGNGKVRLLEAVDLTNSISAAAKEMGMSYRKAWGDIKNVEDNLGFKITEKVRGGKDGGGTVLSDKGKKFIKNYKLMQKELETAINNTFENFKNIFDESE